VNWLAALVLALQASTVMAATAYVSDELVLGVYTEANNQGQRLATLHSGASVETLTQSGDFTQVRLADGTTGWVKSAFLTADQPAVVRVKQLEDELERSRATTPALAEAAARTELARLKQQLAAAQSRLDAAAVGAPPPPAAAVPMLNWPLISAAAVALGLGCGFWLGYATLARRVRHKFGGVKVY
jgi:hypothetical protein